MRQRGIIRANPMTVSLSEEQNITRPHFQEPLTTIQLFTTTATTRSVASSRYSNPLRTFALTFLLSVIGSNVPWVSPVSVFVKLVKHIDKINY
jgi:hypothetical protein